MRYPRKAYKYVSKAEVDEGPKDEFKDRGQCIRPGPVSGNT